MEIGLAVLLFVCMTALLYVILSLKITRQVDQQIRDYYKSTISKDMKEFYRDMEGYTVMFDSRIERFQNLVRRSEEMARLTEGERAIPQPQITSATSEPPAVERPAKAKAAPAAKTKKLTPAEEKKAAKAAALLAAEQKKAAAKKAAAARRASAANEKVQKLSVAATAATARPTPQPVVRPAAEPPPYREERIETADDSAIAEELMRDLYERDELNIGSAKPAAKQGASVHPAAAPLITEDDAVESPAMMSFLSSIGKAIKPMVFGEKPQVAKSSAAPAAKSEPTIARTMALPSEAPQSDFAAVLRRAEQIKAEKKAERERAEVSARAEFYATGDNFQPRAAATAERPSRPQMQPIAEARHEPVQPTERGLQIQAAPRNTLAVKELDAHTKGFLIDSLVQNVGYRKQALKALTENNVSLEEIARLSKIDIGELELMRQLGRF